MTSSKCEDLQLCLFMACTLFILGCHTCPEQLLHDTVSLRARGSCQPFPSQQLFCSQFFNESSMVYIHDNFNYTFLNEQLFEWRNNGHFGHINSGNLITGRPSSFCATQIPYMVCVYLYPPCDDGVPLALCQDQCSNLRSQCCDAINNLISLVDDLDNSSRLHLLCDYDNVDVVGNLYPHPAGDPSCYSVRSVPQIFNYSLLDITGVDYTVAVSENIDPCTFQFNRSYAFVCNASGVPTPQLTWYYQRTLVGEVIIVNNRTVDELVQYYIDSNISIIVISNLTRNNTGIYICNATNDIGFHEIAISAIVARCYDSDATCRPILKAFTLNCSKCIYLNDSCIIQCEPILCSNNSNNCDRMVPTDDGCCMTCASSEDAEDSGLSAWAIAAIIVIPVLTISLFIIIILSLLYFRYIKESRKSNIQHPNTTSVNRSSQGTPPVVKSALTKEEFTMPTKYKKMFSDLSDVEIPWDMLFIGMELGEGAFGTVYKGTITVHQTEDTTDVVDVAVKTINADALDSDEVESFLHESVLMKKIEHPNVLGLLGVCLNTEDGLPYIVLPFMENGDLKTFLRSKRTTVGSNLKYPEGLDHVILLTMCCEISNGMEYLAHRKFVHRDLAARNCLVASDMTVKVGDFGLARQLYSKDYYKLEHRAKVPIKWMALESIYDRIFNEKTDVWAFGITCWEVFTLGGIPYSALEYEDMLLFLQKGSRLCKPQLCSQKVYEVLLKCWQLSPDNRPSFSVLAQELTKLLSPNEYVNVKT